MIGTLGTQFLQYVSGYLGSSVERRGRDAAAQPLWSLPELQDLLDEWIVACWQNRPHDGLRDPVSPGRTFSPNEKYATLIQAAGYVPLALSGEDYIELLPPKWRAINAYGVKINHRVYDDAQLNGLRRQPSGVTDRKDLWAAAPSTPPTRPSKNSAARCARTSPATTSPAPACAARSTAGSRSSRTGTARTPCSTTARTVP
jgi:hypothetical protein